MGSLEDVTQLMKSSSFSLFSIVALEHIFGFRQPIPAAAVLSIFILLVWLAIDYIVEQFVSILEFSASRRRRASGAIIIRQSRREDNTFVEWYMAACREHFFLFGNDPAAATAAE